LSPATRDALLLRASLLPDERALAAWNEVRPALDVATMDGSVTALLPVLRRNLLALGVEDDLLALFKGVHRYNWARTRLLLAPSLPVIADLAQRGIPTMLLKGAALVAEGGVDAGLRSMNDIDVLVPTDRRHEAVGVLLAHGFVPVDDAPAWYVTDHVPDYSPSYGFRDAQDRQLDLHWHVLHGSCQPDADHYFWAASVEVDLFGVPTRTLCPTDELLLVVLHGVRWSDVPSHRWLVDAAMLARGVFGPVDYDRLVDQAQRRRLGLMLARGLATLREVSDAPVPDAVLRALRPRRVAALERLEWRALARAPSERGRLARAALAHQQHARRGAGGALRAERLRRAVPTSDGAAALLDRTLHGDATPLALGEPLDLTSPDVVHHCVAHGTWRPERGGTWLAGRETRIVVPLASAPETSLVLHADGDVLPGLENVDVDVLVSGRRVGTLAFDRWPGASVVLPRAAVAGRNRLELALRPRRRASPAALGLGEDDRETSVRLRSLVLSAPPLMQSGETLSFAAEPRAESMLAGGWFWAEHGGRWTRGREARFLVRVPAATGLMLELDAEPFVRRDGGEVTTKVRAGGSGVADVSRGERRLAIPASAVAEGELLLRLTVRRPRSPQHEGLGEDARPLGAFCRELRLV
jgi:hypothetical protein